MTTVEPAPTPAEDARPQRALILVAGSGRSGTSLVSGMLKRLGARVPQPEVPADDSNPRGFAESRWVVDFHDTLLRRARMQLSDARPGAWTQTGAIALDPEVRAQVNGFLEKEFAGADAVLIKDPRMTWFLPLWRRAATELGASPGVIIMLRHPAAVVASKQTYYDGPQGDSSRVAEWINQTLFTERATRDMPRALLRYTDLLDDWTSALAGVAEALDLSVVRDAPAARIRAAHEFLDASLARSPEEWSEVPEALRDLAEEVWEAVAAPRPDPDRLDALRHAYAKLYRDAEGIVFSSILAGLDNLVAVKRPLDPRTRRWLERIPAPVQRAVPTKLRNRVLRRLRR